MNIYLPGFIIALTTGVVAWSALLPLLDRLPRLIGWEDEVGVSSAIRTSLPGRAAFTIFMAVVPLAVVSRFSLSMDAFLVMSMLWLAIAIAAVGVVYLAATYGRLPWIALTLAFSFGFYGLLKKKTTLGALEGQFLETGILIVPVLAYLGFLEFNGTSALHGAPWTTLTLLILSGVVTAIPLILFAAGAQRVPLTVMGLLQYISPTISFMLGVLLYHEPFNPTLLTGYTFIWIALAIFTAESITTRRRLHLALRPR